MRRNDVDVSLLGNLPSYAEYGLVFILFGIDDFIQALVLIYPCIVPDEVIDPIEYRLLCIVKLLYDRQAIFVGKSTTYVLVE